MLLHVYASRNDAEEEVKGKFYEKLQTIVEETPRHDMLVITGDMNAKLGSDVEGYERVIGRHGVGSRNENGERLCDFCGMNDLVITGTLFPHKEIDKQMWTSSDGRTRNKIDHILIIRKVRASILDTRVPRSADFARDHNLFRTKVKLKLKAAPQKTAIYLER